MKKMWKKLLRIAGVVTATYKIDRKPIGTFGVVGPTRMNYDYVVSVLDFYEKSLTHKSAE